MTADVISIILLKLSFLFLLPFFSFSSGQKFATFRYFHLLSHPLPQTECCCCVASVVSDSVWPHRRQPTRLPHPWDSPGKNTGVGCHFRLQCMKVKSESEVAQSCPTLSDPMDCSPPGSFIHGIFQARVLEWGAIAFSRCSVLATQISEQTWKVVLNSWRPFKVLEW